MKSKKSIIGLLFILSSLNLQAQITPIHIGDKIPEIYLKTIRQYDQVKSANISDYNKGKLLILDFWATWCSPCVGAMPKLDSLQKKFEGQVQILSVSNQPDSLIAAFFQKIYREKSIKPISVVGDTVLNRLFPHNEVPFYVWINSKGIVIAATETDQLNVSSIKNALNGNMDNVRMRTDKPFRKLAENRSLFSVTNGFSTSDGTLTKTVASDQIVYQSIFTKYIPNVISGTKWDSTGYKAQNTSLSFLYRSVYSLIAGRPGLFHNEGRFSIEISDPKLLNRFRSEKIGMEYNKWLQENGVCYELLWRNTKNLKDRFEMLRQDLDRYISKPMGITSRIEKRHVQSYILKRTGKVDFLKSKGGKPEEKFDMYSYSLRNMPLTQLIMRLQGYFYQMSSTPFFDETGLTEPVDLQLNCKMTNMEALNKELKKFGLEFTKGLRNADVLVITDKIN